MFVFLRTAQSTLTVCIMELDSTLCLERSVKYSAVAALLWTAISNLSSVHFYIIH